MTNAIVPRAAGALTRYSFQLSPRQRLALMGMRYAYQNRKTLRRVGKRLIRSYKKRSKKAAVARAAKRQKFSPTRIGHHVGTGLCKRTVTDSSNPTAYNSRTLQTSLVTDIPHVSTGTGNNDIDRRQRNLVNLRGLKVYMEVRNDVAEPLYFHYALLTNKLDDNAGVNVTDFFRGYGEGRAGNHGTANTSIEMGLQAKINTDKYLVLYHKKRLLKPDATGGNYLVNSGKNYTMINFYKKINRQLRWDNTADTQPVNGSIYLVFWADKLLQAGGAVAVTNAFTASTNVTAYFREPKYDCC